MRLAFLTVILAENFCLQLVPKDFHAQKLVPWTAVKTLAVRVF